MFAVLLDYQAVKKRVYIVQYPLDIPCISEKGPMHGKPRDTVYQDPVYRGITVHYNITFYLKKALNTYFSLKSYVCNN